MHKDLEYHHMLEVSSRNTKKTKRDLSQAAISTLNYTRLDEFMTLLHSLISSFYDLRSSCLRYSRSLIQAFVHHLAKRSPSSQVHMSSRLGVVSPLLQAREQSSSTKATKLQSLTHGPPRLGTNNRNNSGYPPSVPITQTP